MLETLDKTTQLVTSVVRHFASTFCINGAMIMMRQGGITALEKALGPSLDSILLSRPVPLKPLRVCDVKKANATYYFLPSTSAYVKLERDCCLFSFREFSDSDPLFFDSLTVRWQLGRVRGSQFLANLSSPQLTLHVSHENSHPAFHC